MTHDLNQAVEFIGFVGHHEVSESLPARGPGFDVDNITRSARAHDKGGFDRVLTAFGARSPKTCWSASTWRASPSG